MHWLIKNTNDAVDDGDKNNDAFELRKLSSIFHW